MEIKLYKWMFLKQGSDLNFFSVCDIFEFLGQSSYQIFKLSS